MVDEKKRKANYSALEIVQNIFFLIYTKIFYRNARLIRLPFIVRGKRYIDFGNNLTVGKNCRIDVMNDHNEKCLKFGNNVNIGFNCRISCADHIDIGNDVLMGSNVLIIDNSHGSYSGDCQDSPETPPNKRNIVSSKITIADNVWIGEGSVIQQGVDVGFGSIIAANSVVTKSIPKYSIAGGIPAKVIKRYEKFFWEGI